MSINVRAIVIRLGSKLHVGNIFQTHNLAVRRGSDNNLFEFAHVIEQSVELDINLVDGTFDSTGRRH